MPFSKQNHIQHEICMFVSTGRVGSRTRILSNDLAGVATPVDNRVECSRLCSRIGLHEDLYRYLYLS